MRITLDIPPSANRYWRHDRGRTHRSHEANAYRDYVALICATVGAEPFDGDIGVRIDFYRRTKAADLDNIFKQLFDALQGEFYHNDNQIADIHARRFDDKDNPRVELEIYPL